MFGYVSCEKAELKMKDYERYSGYYCGVCKSIARRYGQIPRMVLSYDAAFLAALMGGLWELPEIFLDGKALPAPGEGEAPRQEEARCLVKKEHCIVHPLQKKTLVEEPAVDYAADVMLLLAYYKMEDDKRDEGSVKSRALEAFLRKSKERIEEEREELGRIIAAEIRRQSALEQENCPSVDRAADPTGKIMAAILVGMADLPEGTQRILLELGYQLGRWVYLIDGADDLTEDMEKGAYNPFAERFSKELWSTEEAPADFGKSISPEVERILLSCLAGMSDALALLELRRNRAIIENVVHLGLLRQTDRVLAKLRGEAVEHPRRTLKL